MPGVVILATIFIIYEIYKLVFMSRQMDVLGELERMSATKNKTEKRLLSNKAAKSKNHIVTLVVEMCYMIFAVVLFFTQAWFVGLAIIALMFIKSGLDKIRAPRRAVWVIDCLVSIVLLAITYPVYLS
ncbi:hypothetical protein [Heyndrickxia sporothermodurans]|uniref:hypothetical protein n=1 Tax=Heyndrickxia sporothermodurans TaxID=46224 RepID=UPI000D356F8A|nr:hypothetical protein [Heyndrickxia sporothermodurans]PTY93052.1 hypothetical protein B5V90_02915 [Heyndrickxia sporothermodurans]